MIRLHHIAQARSFRTLWLLEEMGLDFDVVRHSFFDGSLRDPSFLSVSPAGRVPALEIDGRVLFESGAITEYLGAGHRLGREHGDMDWANWLEWLHFAETIGQHLANLTQQHIALFEDHMRSPVVMKLEARRLFKTLDVVEKTISRQDYLLGSGFSAVDTSVGYGVLIAQKFVSFAELPALQQYVTRFSSRPAFQRAMAKDGPPEIYTKDFYGPADV
jgi:glutathione S-transferase